MSFLRLTLSARPAFTAYMTRQSPNKFFLPCRSFGGHPEPLVANSELNKKKRPDSLDPKALKESEELPYNNVGKQAVEDALHKIGQPGFNDTPLVGGFGTLAKPVYVLSNFKSRAVGCKGGGDVKHRILFFELKEGPKHVCQECGQVFLLVTPNNFDKHPAAFPETKHSDNVLRPINKPLTTDDE